MQNHSPLSMTARPQILAATGQGKTPRFNMTAYTGGKMTIAGYDYPVVVDLTGLEIPAQVRPVRYNHDVNRGVGHTSRIAVKQGRMLEVEGSISRDTPEAREVAAAGLKGFPWQASIGAAPITLEFVHEGDTAQVNGQQVDGPVYIARQSRLIEISFVDLGADEKTSAEVRAKNATAWQQPTVSSEDLIRRMRREAAAPLEMAARSLEHLRSSAAMDLQIQALRQEHSARILRGR